MSSLGPEARALLEAGRASLRPTTADRERITSALRSRLGNTVLPPDASAPAPVASPPAAAGTLGWQAISAVVVGLALTGAVAVVAFRSPDPKSAPPAVVAAPTPPTAAVPSTGDLLPTAPEPIPAIDQPPPVETQTTTPSPRRPADRLAEEVAILSRAEAELHADRYQGALRVLEEHERKFPRGKLTQERVAARIRALCGLGRTSEANAALARLSPSSLHEGRAREACAAASKK